MIDETTETTETTESKCPSVKQVATCMVLGASTYVFASKAVLYYRLRKQRLAANAQKIQEPVVQAA